MERSEELSLELENARERRGSREGRVGRQRGGEEGRGKERR